MKIMTLTERISQHERRQRFTILESLFLILVGTLLVAAVVYLLWTIGTDLGIDHDIPPPGERVTDNYGPPR